MNLSEDEFKRVQEGLHLEKSPNQKETLLPPQKKTPKGFEKRRRKEKGRLKKNK